MLDTQNHTAPTMANITENWVPVRNLKVASLFAGAGGLDYGFMKAGHQLVWANDIDPDSVETYRQNLGDHIVCGDVSEIDLSTIPEHDVLIAGFPCQGFSNANIHKAKVDNRNNLYFYIVEHLRIHRPKFFLLENVRGILSLGKGAIFEQIQKDLFGLGYEVNHEVLNAADYGVPQNRVRVIITGVRTDLADSNRFVYPTATHSKNDDSVHDWVSIGRALDGIPEPDQPNNLANHVCSKYKVTNRNFTGHRTTDSSKPSPTILARGNGGGGVCAIQHPNNHRRLSVRESAIVQTFPHDFIFTGKMNSMYRQIGNAVPCIFAEKLALGFQEKSDEL